MTEPVSLDGTNFGTHMALQTGFLRYYGFKGEKWLSDAAVEHANKVLLSRRTRQ